MLEWFVSSSALTALMIALRYALRGKIGLRLQYALWALVLLRLLIPVSFGASRLSVQNILPEPEAAAAPATTPSAAALPPKPLTPASPAPATPPPEEVEVRWSYSPYHPIGDLTGEADGTGGQETPPAPVDTGRLLRLIWFAGACLTLLWLLLVNLHFALRLRRSRRPFAAPPDYPLPVYVTEAAETPCLFGLFRPAVYLPPEAAADPALDYILAHEYTHFRHGDHIWSLLRGLALALHWFDPLVWWAAALSRRDGELACDEGALRRLGEGERSAYGSTLIRMTAARRPDLFRAATTMTGSRGSLKERIRLIAKKPKTAVLALIVLILIAAVGAACTFTGAKAKGTEEWFISTAWPLAEKYAGANGLTIEKEGAVVLRYAADKEADVAFPSEDPDRRVVVYFRRWEDGSWHTLEGNAVNLVDRARSLQVELGAGVQGSNPQEVLALALAYTEERLNDIRHALGVRVTSARLTGLTPMGAGTAGLTEGLDLYRLEYRFRLAEPESAVLPEGMLLEGDDLTEWSEGGQPYLLLRWEVGEIGTEWSFICATSTMELENVYHTPEMLEKYGDTCTAACAELYARSLASGEGAAQPWVTVSSGKGSVTPLAHMRWAQTWMGSGWLAADGVPPTETLNRYGTQYDRLTLIRDGEVSLTFSEEVRPGSPMLRLYDENLHLLEMYWEDPEGVLAALGSGTYWCGIVVAVDGEYIPAAGRRESAGYEFLFRLVVPDLEEIRTVTENPALYALPEPDLSPEAAALRLAGLMLEDLGTEDPARTFRITEYGDLEVQVFSTAELWAAADNVYHLREDMIGENLWIAEIRARFRWEGTLSPLGPSDGNRWAEQLYQGSPYGFLLTRTAEGYTLQSRYYLLTHVRRILAASDLDLLREISGFTPADWDRAVQSGEFPELSRRLLEAATGEDQSQRDIFVMSAALRSDGAYTELLAEVLRLQYEAEPHIWEEALSAFTAKEADLLRQLANSAEETN